MRGQSTEDRNGQPEKVRLAVPRLFQSQVGAAGSLRQFVFKLTN